MGMPYHESYTLLCVVDFIFNSMSLTGNSTTKIDAFGRGKK